jgi:hypothetical protein
MDKAIIIRAKLSENIKLFNNVYPYLTYKDENIGPIVLLFKEEKQEVKQNPGETIVYYIFGSISDKLHELSVLDKFKLITEEFVVTDEEGNDLLTLETLTLDNFEIIIDYGNTVTYLIIGNTNEGR